MEIGLPVAAILAILAFILFRVGDWSPIGEYKTAQGMIQETRIVVAYTRDNQYGGSIYYRIEARVKYKYHGADQLRWLPSSDVTNGREMLEMKLAAHPTSCLVYWLPKYPENAKCSLK
jgi:hypothetical protein